MVQPIFPKLATGKCSSCYIMGFKTFYQGIKLRQVIPFQTEVIELLQQHLAQGPLRFMDVLPEIRTTSVNYIYPESWSELYRKSDLAMRRVRKSRPLIG